MLKCQGFHIGPEGASKWDLAIILTTDWLLSNYDPIEISFK